MHFEIHVKLVLSKLRCSDQRDQNTSSRLLLHHQGIKLLLMQYMDTITNEKKIGLTEILYLYLIQFLFEFRVRYSSTSRGMSEKTFCATVLLYLPLNQKRNYNINEITLSLTLFGSDSAIFDTLQQCGWGSTYVYISVYRIHHI